MPREVLALARLFPVMLQVDAVLMRRNASTICRSVTCGVSVAALRELLARISIASAGPYIDDLQCPTPTAQHCLKTCCVRRLAALLLLSSFARGLRQNHF